MVSHAFSTRHGGVSEGVFSTMNFSFTRNDDPQHVMENYRRIAAVLGTDAEKMVLSYQTHHQCPQSDGRRRKGHCKERDYQDVDGLITDIPGITLVTFTRTVPLYFCGSGPQGCRTVPFRLEGTVHRMGKSHAGGHEPGIRHRTGGCHCLHMGRVSARTALRVGPEVAAEFADGFCRAVP